MGCYRLLELDLIDQRNSLVLTRTYSHFCRRMQELEKGCCGLRCLAEGRMIRLVVVCRVCVHDLTAVKWACWSIPVWTFAMPSSKLTTYQKVYLWVWNGLPVKVVMAGRPLTCRIEKEPNR